MDAKRILNYLKQLMTNNTEAITCIWSQAIVWWPVATTGCPQIS